MSHLTIVSRTSPLAMWQAEFVRGQLSQHYPNLKIKIIGIKTLGDKILDTPLDKIGGKGLFVKELEQALLSGKASLAVHSLKDVPSVFPSGLGLGAICKRDNPFDAWICPTGHTLEKLPAGCRVGTSSLRRAVQLKRLRPEVEFVPLRGNVDTRLRKCQAGEWDAIVLAVAGLTRLNLQAHITHIFSEQQLLPAVAQGALGIECRMDDIQTLELVAALDHAPTRFCIEAERAMNAALGGSCQIPVAGFATLQENGLQLTGRVGNPENFMILEATKKGALKNAVKLGQEVASDLIQQGAQEIIDKIMSEE